MSRAATLLLAASLAAGLAGCLPDTRYRLASFLFDGVPALRAQPAEESARPAPVAKAGSGQVQAAAGNLRRRFQAGQGRGHPLGLQPLDRR